MPKTSSAITSTVCGLRSFSYFVCLKRHWFFIIEACTIPATFQSRKLRMTGREVTAQASLLPRMIKTYQVLRFNQCSALNTKMHPTDPTVHNQSKISHDTENLKGISINSLMSRHLQRGFLFFPVLDICGWYQDIGFGKRKRLLRLTTAMESKLAMRTHLFEWHLSRTECRSVSNRGEDSKHLRMHSNHGTMAQMAPDLSLVSGLYPCNVDLIQAASAHNQLQQLHWATKKPENTIIPSLYAGLLVPILHWDILLWPVSTSNFDKILFPIYF